MRGLKAYWSIRIYICVDDDTDNEEFIHTYNNFRKSNSTVKGRLSKMKTEVLGSGPMEGSPEPDMDQAFV